MSAIPLRPGYAGPPLHRAHARGSLCGGAQLKLQTNLYTPDKNPASLFQNHKLALLNNHLYDPSYGNKYPVQLPIFPVTNLNIHNAIKAFEDASVEGFIVQTPLDISEANIDQDLDGDGLKNNTVTSDCIISRKHTDPDVELFWNVLNW